MLIRVDQASQQSLADQIATQIRAGIVSGALVPGERLPPARELSVSLRVNMHTVLRAYQHLRDEGLIEMRQGRGAFIRQDAGAASVKMSELMSQLASEAKKLGLSAQELHSRLDRAIGGTA